MTEKELNEIANLAMIDISKNDKQKMIKDLQGVIDLANGVLKVETDENSKTNDNELKNVYREDVVEKSIPQEEVLLNAIDSENGFFKI